MVAFQWVRRLGAWGTTFNAELRGTPTPPVAFLGDVGGKPANAEHDELACVTSVGTAYYLDEIRRRDSERQTASNLKLARAAFWLTVANTLLAVVAVLISLLTP